MADDVKTKGHLGSGTVVRGRNAGKTVHKKRITSMKASKSSACCSKSVPPKGGRPSPKPTAKKGIKSKPR